MKYMQTESDKVKFVQSWNVIQTVHRWAENVWKWNGGLTMERTKNTHPFNVRYAVPVPVYVCVCVTEYISEYEHK